MPIGLTARARQLTSRAIVSVAFLGATLGTALAPTAAHAAPATPTPTSKTSHAPKTATLSRPAGMGGIGGGGIFQPCLFGPSTHLYNSGDMASPFAPFIRINGSCYTPDSTVYVDVTMLADYGPFNLALDLPVSVDSNGNFEYLLFISCTMGNYGLYPTGHQLNISVNTPTIYTTVWSTTTTSGICLN